MNLINNTGIEGNCGIYLVYSTKGDLCYVGSSSELKRRFAKHKHYLKHGKHFRQEMQNLSNDFGFDNMVFEILEFCTEEDLITREQFHLDDNISTATNKRIFVDSNKGLKHSKERIAKALASRIKNGFIPFSNIDRSKRAGENHHYFGKERDQTTRDKISANNKGKHKVICLIYQYTLDGVFIKSFESSVEASKEVNVSAGSIRGVISGSRKTAGGFIWKR